MLITSALVHSDSLIAVLYCLQLAQMYGFCSAYNGAADARTGSGWSWWDAGTFGCFLLALQFVVIL